jgi:hypothetical protein
MHETKQRLQLGPTLLSVALFKRRKKLPQGTKVCGGPSVLVAVGNTSS